MVSKRCFTTVSAFGARLKISGKERRVMLYEGGKLFWGMNGGFELLGGGEEEDDDEVSWE